MRQVLDRRIQAVSQRVVVCLPRVAGAAELDAHLTEDEDVPILSSSDNESSPYGSDAELGLRSAL